MSNTENYFKNKTINVFDNKVEDNTGKVTTLTEDTSHKYSGYKKVSKTPADYQEADKIDIPNKVHVDEARVYLEKFTTLNELQIRKILSNQNEVNGSMIESLIEISSRSNSKNKDIPKGTNTSPIYVIKVKGEKIDLSKINDNATIIIQGDVILSESEALRIDTVGGDIIKAKNINAETISGDVIDAKNVTSKVIQGDVTSKNVTAERIEGDVIK